MINKQKLYSIALISAAMILMLVSIAGAAPFAYISNLGSNTVSVIDTANNIVTATVNVGIDPLGIAVTPDGSKVYVTDFVNVSVINTTTNTVTATVAMGAEPYGVAVSPDGTKVYVTNEGNNTISVINTTTNTVTATVNVGSFPIGVAVSPDGTKVYVANQGSNTVSVINTTTNTVTATVAVGAVPYGVAVSPDGTKVYVTNSASSNVSVINTTTDTVIATVNGLINPSGVAVTPDGANVYVANAGDSNVSVINTTINTVTATVNVGNNPKAFGQFIGKAIPTITWTNPANITYGTALTGTQLDATSPEFGTFAYTPPSGTVLSVGQNQQLNTTFTPTDITYYTTASASVFINVTQVTPTITWNNPADIINGTALSGTQLDATASIPGNFVYNPPSGTVLSVGQNQQLNTTFTPTDITNYTTASASVFINVVPAVPALNIIKIANLTSYDHVDQIIGYNYMINNTGNVNLTAPFTVTDNLTTVGYTAPTELQPGQNFTGTATYTITQSDYDNGSVTNLANATGFYNNTQYTATNTTTITATGHNPALNITKIASPTNYSAVGDLITYTYNVTNSGNIDILLPINITDNRTGNIQINNSKFAYITNSGSNNVSVLNTTTNTVTATVPVGLVPFGVT